jgi:hypothetical protein
VPLSSWKPGRPPGSGFSFMRIDPISWYLVEGAVLVETPFRGIEEALGKLSER